MKNKRTLRDIATLSSSYMVTSSISVSHLAIHLSYNYTQKKEYIIIKNPITFPKFFKTYRHLIG